MNSHIRNESSKFDNSSLKVSSFDASRISFNSTFLLLSFFQIMRTLRYRLHRISNFSNEIRIARIKGYCLAPSSIHQSYLLDWLTNKSSSFPRQTQDLLFIPFYMSMYLLRKVNDICHGHQHHFLLH